MEASGERRDPSSGDRRDAGEGPFLKEPPPCGEYLRALLDLQQHDLPSQAGEPPVQVFGLAHSRGSGEESPEMAAEAGAPSPPAAPVVAAETPSSGDHEKPAATQPLAALRAAAPGGTTVSVPSMAPRPSPSDGDAEAVRRRTLFEIQRLMLEARPYDSIEFFHVQRELVKYLGLEPHRRASITDYTITLAPPGTGGSRADPAAPSAAASGGFWKRLRSRWRRSGGGGGCIGGGADTGCVEGEATSFKGDGDVAVGPSKT